MIELASVIRDLRDELERAAVAGEGAALRFELGTIELELELVVERSAEGGGRVRFWVLELGGSQSREATSTQRVKLLLTPRTGESGEGLLVSGRSEPGEG